MRALDWLILIAAAWRLSYMLVNEDGPLNIIVSVRLAIMRWALLADRRASRWHIVARGRVVAPLVPLLECEYCMSVWVAALLYVGRSSVFLAAVTGILALSAGVIAMKAAHDALRTITTHIENTEEREAEHERQNHR
jgi:hypothetical protein